MTTPSSATLNIDVCICTSRCPHLTETLQSLGQLWLPPEIRINIIIADYDDIPSAKALAIQASKGVRHRIQYIHIPSKKVAAAKNACLDNATAPFLAFLDDNKTASPGWLTALLDQYVRTKADVVLGPIKGQYPRDCPSWIKRGDYHSIHPSWFDDKIENAYTGNALLSRSSAALKDLRFDTFLDTQDLDSSYFISLHKKGGHVDYAAAALVYEQVARGKLNLDWLMQHSFVEGLNHGHFLIEKYGQNKIKRFQELIISLTKATLCNLASLASSATNGQRQYWLIHGALHAGTLKKLMKKETQPQFG